MTKSEDVMDILARHVADVTRARIMQQDTAPVVEMARSKLSQAQDALTSLREKVERLDRAVAQAGVELGAYE